MKCDGKRPHEELLGSALRGHLSDSGETPLTGERFTQLLSLDGVTVELIHSSDSPPADEYCQDHDEWVMVVNGRAKLECAGEIIEMEAEDWLLIPAGMLHRVLATEYGTRWLAIHIDRN